MWLCRVGANLRDFLSVPAPCFFVPDFKAKIAVLNFVVNVLFRKNRPIVFQQRMPFTMSTCNEINYLNTHRTQNLMVAQNFMLSKINFQTMTRKA